MSPEAGWYADPTDPSAVRWWDGSSWSAETRPAPRELAMAGAIVGTGTLATAEDSRPVVGTVAAPPAPDPAPAPVPTGVVAPPSPGETSDELVDRSRPGARRATPPAPEPVAVRPPTAGTEDADDVDRSRPGARRAVPPADPAHADAAAPATSVAAARPSAPTLPASPWVDSSASPAGAGHGFGGAAPVAFGAGLAGHGGVPNGFGGADLGPMHQGTYHATRSWKVPTAIGVVLVLVLGGAAAVAIPKYRDARAQATAAQAPNVLVHSAPRVVAGQKKLAVPGVPAMGQRLTDAGAAWAWAQAYGTRNAVTLYVASDVPLASRADAVRALTNHQAATTLLTEVSAGITSGGQGQAVAGTPAEYASPVGGKTWCMPMTVSGVTGGYCLWTSGKEWLQVLSLPGLEQVAAKFTMTSLTQMAAAETQAGPASTLVPKPAGA